MWLANRKRQWSQNRQKKWKEQVLRNIQTQHSQHTDLQPKNTTIDYGTVGVRQTKSNTWQVRFKYQGAERNMSTYKTLDQATIANEIGRKMLMPTKDSKLTNDEIEQNVKAARAAAKSAALGFTPDLSNDWYTQEKEERKTKMKLSAELSYNKDKDNEDNVDKDDDLSARMSKYLSPEYQAEKEVEKFDKAWAESVLGSKLRTTHGNFALDRIDYSAKNGKHFICKFDDDDSDDKDYPMAYEDVKNHLMTG